MLSVLRAGATSKRPLNAAEATVGGKTVIVITYSTPYPLGLKRYFYASADRLYDIRRAPEATAAEILQALP